MDNQGGWPGGNGGGRGEDFDPLVELKNQFEKWRKGKKTPNMPSSKLIWLVPVVALLVWLGSGIYFVEPGEIGVERLFGKEVAQTEPGPHYAFPQPIQRVDTVNMEKIRRAEIGFRSNERYNQPSFHERHLEESLMLTGDENIADIQVVVQYRVKDASNFLFEVRDPEISLGSATEVALRGIIGKTTIDDAMTRGRSKVETDVRTFLQMLMDNYKTGIHVAEVKLLVVDPPDEVKDAFHEVVRALEDKERLVREAEGYREDIVPKARGDAQTMIKGAEAYLEKRVKEAEGEAIRFERVLDEYNKAKNVTRERLYLEFVQENLAGVEKFIINPSAGGGGLQKVLPMKSLIDLEPVRAEGRSAGGR